MCFKMILPEVIGHTDIQIPLQFQPGPMPCLNNSYQYKIQEQGKDTNNHLLPLGDWTKPLMGHPLNGHPSPLTGYLTDGDRKFQC